MDRVIKFRWKSKESKNGKFSFCELKVKNGALYFSSNPNSNGMFFLAQDVSEDSVGQFTGLKDIDGKEIYEDDIIQNDAHPDIIERVFMYGDCWSVGFYPDEANPLAWTLENAPFKVIGNIHDNPKLLEGGN